MRGSLILAGTRATGRSYSIPKSDGVGGPCGAAPSAASCSPSPKASSSLQALKSRPKSLLLLSLSPSSSLLPHRRRWCWPLSPLPGISISISVSISTTLTESSGGAARFPRPPPLASAALPTSSLSSLDDEPSAAAPSSPNGVPPASPQRGGTSRCDGRGAASTWCTRSGCSFASGRCPGNGGDEDGRRGFAEKSAGATATGAGSRPVPICAVAALTDAAGGGANENAATTGAAKLECHVHASWPGCGAPLLSSPAPRLRREKKRCASQGCVAKPGNPPVLPLPWSPSS